MQPTRQTLIERVQSSKDHASWEEFVETYKLFLYTVVRRMSISHHDTEEIIQTVFLKVWDKIQGFEYHPNKGKFRYWLCRIARNAVIDFIRKSQSESNKRNKAQQEISPSTIPEVEEFADIEWKNFLANKALEEIKKTEKPHMIECFILHSQGLSIAEISEKLNLAENSVYIYKARILDLMRRKIRNFEETIG